jgi:hypothetical protein
MAVHGYPKLASHISTAPSSLITRSFASLAARNILYLQAELVHLEIKLQELESRDSTSPVGKKEMFAKDWYWLQSSGTEAEGEQWATVLDIRGKLKEYRAWGFFLFAFFLILADFGCVFGIYGLG